MQGPCENEEGHPAKLTQVLCLSFTHAATEASGPDPRGFGSYQDLRVGGAAAPCHLGGECRQEAPVFWQSCPGWQGPQLPGGHGAQQYALEKAWASPHEDSHNF